MHSTLDEVQPLKGVKHLDLLLYIKHSGSQKMAISMVEIFHFIPSQISCLWEGLEK
jgi:hypothetical protein